jgi:hypothetical protein
MKTTIALDFDGVIHTYHRGWHDGTIYGHEIPGAFDSIRALLKDHNVFIFSSRKPSQILEWISEQMEDVAFEVIDKDAKFWTTRNVVGITNRKMPASIYVDDRGLHFENWMETMKMIALRST